MISKSYLDQNMMEEWRTWTPETGVPQGVVLSPVSANLYLNPLDHQLAEAGFEMVRYADDSVISCRSLEEAESALTMVRTRVESIGLNLHSDKTQIVDSREQSCSLLRYSYRGRMIFSRQRYPRVVAPDLRAHLKKQVDLDSTLLVRGRRRCSAFAIEPFVSLFGVE